MLLYRLYCIDYDIDCTRNKLVRVPGHFISHHVPCHTWNMEEYCDDFSSTIAYD